MSSMRGWGKFYGNIVERPSQDGHSVDMVIEGGFSLMAGAKNMMCEDGIERNFFASTGYADSFWTMEGWVNAYGKRVKGFIMYSDPLERWTFRATGVDVDFLLVRPTTAEVWDVTVEDSTPSLECAQDPDRPNQCPDPIQVYARRFKHRASARRYIDRFAMGLQKYAVLEHVETDDESYLRCLGRRAWNQEVKVWEIVARRSVVSV